MQAKATRDQAVGGVAVYHAYHIQIYVPRIRLFYTTCTHTMPLPCLQTISRQRPRQKTRQNPRGPRHNSETPNRRRLSSPVPRARIQTQKTVRANATHPINVSRKSFSRGKEASSIQTRGTPTPSCVRQQDWTASTTTMKKAKRGGRWPQQCSGSGNKSSLLFIQASACGESPHWDCWNEKHKSKRAMSYLSAACAAFIKEVITCSAVVPRKASPCLLWTASYSHLTLCLLLLWQRSLLTPARGSPCVQPN